MENLLEIINLKNILLNNKSNVGSYPKFTLNDISFSIPKGTIVGFIGRNGAGKSTTLKGIMNLVHFDSGEVIAFDKSMKENELYAKQEIGFSLSEVNYYPNKTIMRMNGTGWTSPVSVYSSAMFTAIYNTVLQYPPA